MVAMLRVRGSVEIARSEGATFGFKLIPVLLGPDMSTHYYDRSGAPVYEIVGANGKLRAPTLTRLRGFEG
jgi:hypothetical protein